MSYLLRLIILNIMFLIPVQVYAYFGPGLGITAIGSLIALISGISITLIGLVWFPLQKLIKKAKIMIRTSRLDNSESKSVPNQNKIEVANKSTNQS